MWVSRKSSLPSKLIFFLIFIYVASSSPACGIYFFDQGSNPGPLHWEPRVLATRPPRKSLITQMFLSQDTIPVLVLADDYNLDFDTYLSTIKSFLWQALGTRGHLTCPKGFPGEWEQQCSLKREWAPLHPRPLHPRPGHPWQGRWDHIPVGPRVSTD